MEYARRLSRFVVRRLLARRLTRESLSILELDSALEEPRSHGRGARQPSRANDCRVAVCNATADTARIQSGHAARRRERSRRWPLRRSVPAWSSRGRAACRGCVLDRRRAAIEQQGLPDTAGYSISAQPMRPPALPTGWPPSSFFSWMMMALPRNELASPAFRLAPGATISSVPLPSAPMLMFPRSTEVAWGGLGQRVRVRLGVEVSARARRVRRAAVPFLVDVRAVLAGRQVLQREGHLDAAARLGERPRASERRAALRLKCYLHRLAGLRRRWSLRGRRGLCRGRCAFGRRCLGRFGFPLRARARGEHA